MYYNLNGIISEKPIDDKFWITENQIGDFILKNRDITFEIDSKCVQLRDEISTKIFGSMDEYHRLASFASSFLVYGGIDAEIKISKEEFEKITNKISSQETSNKLLYYYDITNIIGTIQNSVLESKFLFGNFYKLLNTHSFLLNENIPIVENGVQFASGLIVTNITSTTNHLFINLYSLLDFLVKIVYEFENLTNDFSKYPKLKSKDILFGDAKKTKLKDLKNSVFELSETIKLIISFRNEIVHNASIDNIPKVYQVISDSKLIEKFIYLPDTKDGYIKTFKNRKRFFNDEVKLNELLPELVTDFWSRILITLNAIK